MRVLRSLAISSARSRALEQNRRRRKIGRGDEDESAICAGSTSRAAAAIAYKVSGRIWAASSLFQSVTDSTPAIVERGI